MSGIIGGEFSISSELLKLKERELESSNIKFSSGRSALFSILCDIEKKRGIKGRILLPSYLCNSITQTIIDAEWRFDFYELDSTLHIELDSSDAFSNYDTILLINYFGLLDLDNDISILRKLCTHLVIIEDDVQAFYNMEYSKADYSFCSLRKWFPCIDGAITKPSNIPPLNKKCSLWSHYKFAGNILKSYSGYVDDSLILELLRHGENLLENEYLTECSSVSRIIFSNLKLERIAQIRKENAKVLHCELARMNIPHLYNEDAVPLFIPIFIENRDELRKDFFDRKIFTPKHWEWVSNSLNGKCAIYDIELSLICDQRYGKEDMDRQISVIRDFISCR